MSRIPYPDLEKVSEEKKAVVANPGAAKLLNISHMAMHAPDPQWRSQRALGQSFIYQTSIDKPLKEMIILRVGHLSNSEYEVYHHEAIARKLGFTEARIAALARADYADFTPAERAALVFADEVVTIVAPKDETIVEMRKHFTDERLFEIMFLVCSYMMTARVVAVGGCKIEEEAVGEWSATPGADILAQPGYKKS
jgi:4-carboxymuconolactone decarboxylase